MKQIMQNKPNLLAPRMNVSSVNTREYENEIAIRLAKNKPNTNPIKPNFRNDKMNTTFYFTKCYENQPRLPAPGKQTQTNPIPPARYAIRDTKYKPNLSRRSLWRSRIKPRALSAPENTLRVCNSRTIDYNYRAC